MPSEGAHWSLSAMWEEGQLGRRSAGSFGAHLGEVGVPSPPSRVIPQLHELGGGGGGGAERQSCHTCKAGFG